MTTSNDTGAPMKAVKLIEKLGFSRYRPGEVMELWLEIRRFAWRRFHVWPESQRDTGNIEGIFKRLVLAFLKTHGLHFFPEERLEMCPELTVYDSSASDNDLWQKFEPLGTLIWDAKSNYKMFPKWHQLDYRRLLKQERDIHEASRNDESDGEASEDIGDEEQDSIANSTMPIGTSSATRAIASDYPVKKRGAIPSFAISPAKRSSPASKLQKMGSQPPSSWETAIQVDPIDLEWFGPKVRRVQFAFVTENQIFWWPSSRGDARFGYSLFSDFQREMSLRIGWKPSDGGEAEFRCENTRVVYQATRPVDAWTQSQDAYSGYTYYLVPFLDRCTQALAESPDDCIRIEIRRKHRANSQKSGSSHANRKKKKQTP